MWPGELEISDLEVASEESVDATGALGGQRALFRRLFQYREGNGLRNLETDDHGTAACPLESDLSLGVPQQAFEALSSVGQPGDLSLG
jgi:hypothetical protein